MKAYSVAPFSIFLAVMLLAMCGGGGKPSDSLHPAMRMSVDSLGMDAAVVLVETINADGCVLLLEKTAEAPEDRTAEEIVAKGARHGAGKTALRNLEQATRYRLWGVAVEGDKRTGLVETLDFTTRDMLSDLYAWEKKRTAIPSYRDLALVYGGSSHRSPFRWDSGRMAPMVSYKDLSGVEHWLFDAFLAIEFLDKANDKAYNLGQRYGYGDKKGKAIPSADRSSWQALLNYWFESGYGLDALDAAIGEAAGRMGPPSSMRKVVMVMPDPIPYELFDITSSSTTYWGQLDGRTMDFSKGEDRVAVLEWWINEVRRSFNIKQYRHIELAGFYIVSEDLAVPGYGWNPELKRWEEIYPELADYIHGLKESLCWIPYNRAGGWQLWRQRGIDHAYMQPNYFWDDAGKISMPAFFADIKSKDMAMELEMDDLMLGSGPSARAYRQRFREYMEGCRSNGIYAEKPLAYYMGENTMYNLAHSTHSEDIAMHQEFCRFVSEHAGR